METNLTITLLIVFLGLSAFFSSSETAFFGLQEMRLHHLIASGKPRAQRLARLKAEPERFLSTILLGNNLVNTALTALATGFAISVLGDDNKGIGVIIATALVTGAIVIVGEAAPKTLAARQPERLALLFVQVWEILDRVLSPLATVLHAISSLLTRPFQRADGGQTLLSEDELRTMVTLGERTGAVEEAEASIIQKTLGLGDLRAQEVMTPRTEIVWVPKGSTLNDFWKSYAQETHTRFPVYEGDQDNVIGTLALKDVVKASVEARLRDKDLVDSLVRPAHFFPESKPVDNLIVEMRTGGTQIVLLVNEYGGIAGLLTMKQIVGEVVGRITEVEEEQPEFETIDENTIQVDGGMRVDEANEKLVLEIPDGDYETLAGFVLANLGHIPRVGEELRCDGLRLVVTEMDGVRIERIEVTRN